MPLSDSTAESVNSKAESNDSSVASLPEIEQTQKQSCVCVVPLCKCNAYTAKDPKGKAHGLCQCTHSRAAHELMTLAAKEALRKELLDNSASPAVPCQLCECTHYQGTKTALSMFKLKSTATSSSCLKPKTPCRCTHSEDEHRPSTKADLARRAMEQSAAEHPCAVGQCSCQGYVKDHTRRRTEFGVQLTCIGCAHEARHHRPHSVAESEALKRLAVARRSACRKVLQPGDRPRGGKRGGLGFGTSGVSTTARAPSDSGASTSQWRPVDHHRGGVDDAADGWGPVVPLPLPGTEGVHHDNTSSAAHSVAAGTTSEAGPTCDCPGFGGPKFAKLAQILMGRTVDDARTVVTEMQCRDCGHALSDHRPPKAHECRARNRAMFALPGASGHCTLTSTASTAPTAALAMDPPGELSRLRLAVAHDSLVTHAAVHSGALQRPDATDQDTSGDQRPTHARVTSLVRHLRCGCTTPLRSKRRQAAAAAPSVVPSGPGFSTRYGHTVVVDVDSSPSESRAAGKSSSSGRGATEARTVSYAPPALGPAGLCAVAGTEGTIVVTQTPPLPPMGRDGVTGAQPPSVPSPLRVPLAQATKAKTSFCVTAMALANTPNGRDKTAADDDECREKKAISTVTFVASVVKSETDAKKGFSTSTSLMTCSIAIDPTSGLMTGNASPWHIIGLETQADLQAAGHTARGEFPRVLRFNTTGTMLACTGDLDGVVRICNVSVRVGVAGTQATPQLAFVAAQQLDFGRVLCAVWSPCGQFLCVGGEDDAVSVLRVARMERPQRAAEKQPRRQASMMQFVTKQKQYAIGITPVRVLQEHTSFVSAMCFDASGRILATAGYDGRICCWSAEDVLRESPHSGLVGRAFVEPPCHPLSSFSVSPNFRGQVAVVDLAVALDAPQLAHRGIRQRLQEGSVVAVLQHVKGTVLATYRLGSDVVDVIDPTYLRFLHSDDTSVVEDDDALTDDDRVDVLDDGGKSVAEKTRTGFSTDSKGHARTNTDTSSNTVSARTNGKLSLKQSLSSLVLNKSNKSGANTTAGALASSTLRKNQLLLEQASKGRSSSAAFPSSAHAGSKKARLLRSDSGESDPGLDAPGGPSRPTKKRPMTEKDVERKRAAGPKRVISSSDDEAEAGPTGNKENALPGPGRGGIPENGCDQIWKRMDDFRSEFPEYFQDEMLHGELVPNSFAWAKYKKFPWWPCKLHSETKRKRVWKIVYFGDNSTSNVPESKLVNFCCKNFKEFEREGYASADAQKFSEALVEALEEYIEFVQETYDDDEDDADGKDADSDGLRAMDSTAAASSAPTETNERTAAGVDGVVSGVDAATDARALKGRVTDPDGGHEMVADDTGRNATEVDVTDTVADGNADTTANTEMHTGAKTVSDQGSSSVANDTEAQAEKDTEKGEAPVTDPNDTNGKEVDSDVHTGTTATSEVGRSDDINLKNVNRGTACFLLSND
eukprot:m.770751 g.770751  ORF g.770751 m.770751 type:complete len:1452 (+) comp23242_c0_seq1:309-4664(+)